MKSELENDIRRIIREELAGVEASLSALGGTELLTLSDMARNLNKTPRTIREHLKGLRLYSTHGHYTPEVQNRVAEYMSRPRKPFKPLSAFMNHKRKSDNAKREQKSV